MEDTSFYKAGEYYHIYNRAVGSERLFYSPENYRFFIRKSGQYLNEVFDFLSYCLMPNHFHFLVRAKENGNPDHQLRRFFISYSMALNKFRSRMGSLFMKPYKKKFVETEEYLTTLIFYIHLNPVHHGFTNSFEDYKWSSYQAIIRNESGPLDLKIDQVVGWLGGIEAFRSGHRINKELYSKEDFKDAIF